MPVGSAVAIYLLIWFLTLFAVLPFGVRTTREAGGEPITGQADSAPHAPALARKLGWTTLVSAVIFGIFYANYVAEWVTIADVSIREPSAR